MQASFNHASAVVKVLLRAGADPNDADNVRLQGQCVLLLCYLLN
jgi:hypothetical protein